MKIAVVHDQLQEFGGAERVLVALTRVFPDAHIYTSFYNPTSLGVHKSFFKDLSVRTSWADKIFLLKRLYSPFRFLTPWIWESLDLRGYDVVISSSGSYMCKGVVTRPETVHICYLHHPPRYLYNYETAIEWQKYLPVKIYGHLINHKLRMWDYLSSQRVDYFVANSEETRDRIAKFYRRDAEVVYPPVNIPTQNSKVKTKHYYVTVSRLARAKHVDVLIEAANKMKFRLRIVGTGRDEKYLKSIAGQTVEFMGSVRDKKLANLYGGAEAFLFASRDEEFGIAPVEAMGHGVPVIAYKSGGVVETVTEGVNGFLFDKLTRESLISRIKQFKSLSSEKKIQMRIAARRVSQNFSEEKFKNRIIRFVEDKTKRR